MRKDKLFDYGEYTISIYAKISEDLTLVVQFLNSDYIKVLPKFHNILDVPLIVIAEVAKKT